MSLIDDIHFRQDLFDYLQSNLKLEKTFNNDPEDNSFEIELNLEDKEINKSVCLGRIRLEY